MLYQSPFLSSYSVNNPFSLQQTFFSTFVSNKTKLEILQTIVQLTKGLSSKHASIFSNDSSASVSLISVLNEGVTLVNRAAEHAAVFGEDGLDVALFHHGCVQVSNEHARVDRFGVVFVGDVARLNFQGHLGSNVDSNLWTKRRV